MPAPHLTGIGLRAAPGFSQHRLQVAGSGGDVAQSLKPEVQSLNMLERHLDCMAGVGAHLATRVPSAVLVADGARRTRRLYLDDVDGC